MSDRSAKPITPLLHPFRARTFSSRAVHHRSSSVLATSSSTSRALAISSARTRSVASSSNVIVSISAGNVRRSQAVPRADHSEPSKLRPISALPRSYGGGPFGRYQKSGDLFGRNQYSPHRAPKALPAGDCGDMVRTNMASTPDRNAWLWPRNRLRIAQVLVDADGPMPGSAIGTALNMDTSNVNKQLGALGAAECVSVRPPDPEESVSVGRPSRYWALDAEQRKTAEQVLAEDVQPQPPARGGSDGVIQKVDNEARGASTPPAAERHANSTPCLAAGSELVIAAVPGSRLIDLMAVLAANQEAPRPTWTALCGDQLVFAFDEPDPPGRALDLMSILKNVTEGRIRRSTVTRVWLGEELEQQAAALADRS